MPMKDNPPITVEVIEPPRHKNGQFVKGFSGRQYKAIGKTLGDECAKDATEQAKELAPSALAVVAKLMMDKTASPTTRLNAAKEILNRACGKPAIVVKQRSEEQYEGVAVESLSLEAQREIVLAALKEEEGGE